MAGLELKGVSKSFDSVHVIHVDLSIADGGCGFVGPSGCENRPCCA